MALGTITLTVNVLIFTVLRLKTGFVINVEIPAPQSVTQSIVETLL
jgi:hypothetical protein